MPQGKYLAGGLQSGCTANSIGVQYTLPQYRRKGLAEQLVRNCLQSAREWGAGRVCLGATEEGMPLYEKLSFWLMKDEMQINI